MIEQEKQILSAYIDGTLSSTKKIEFEALLKKRADLQEEILRRRTQISRMTGYIPRVGLSKEARENIEQEIKSTIKQVIEQKNDSLWEKIKNTFSR